MLVRRYLFRSIQCSRCAAYSNNGGNPSHRSDRLSDSESLWCSLGIMSYSDTNQSTLLFLKDNVTLAARLYVDRKSGPWSLMNAYNCLSSPVLIYITGLKPLIVHDVDVISTYGRNTHMRLHQPLARATMRIRQIDLAWFPYFTSSS